MNQNININDDFFFLPLDLRKCNSLKLHYGSVWIELILLKLKTENTVAK